MIIIGHGVIVPAVDLRYVVCMIDCTVDHGIFSLSCFSEKLFRLCIECLCPLLNRKKMPGVFGVLRLTTFLHMCKTCMATVRCYLHNVQYIAALTVV